MATPSNRWRTLSTAIISTNSSNPAAISSSSYFLPELIPLIASRLRTLEDFFALRAACRAYQALLLPSPSNLASQAPLLLATQKASASGTLFHLPLRRILRLSLPLPNTLAGAAQDVMATGFYSFSCRVAIYDRMVSRRRELRIVDLLTGERALLPDPACHFDRAIFSGDLVLTSMMNYREVRYCRIGDARWRVASCDEAYLLKSVIFVKGTLYALVDPGCRLAVVELSDNNSVELSFLGGAQTETVHDDPLSVLALAEYGGKLLLMRAGLSWPHVYHIFRWRSGEGKWERTTSLGGCSLFFNIYQFAGCLGPNHPVVRRDCIYLTESLSREWFEYSLADGSFRGLVADFPGGEGTGAYGVPVWVLPSIC